MSDKILITEEYKRLMVFPKKSFYGRVVRGFGEISRSYKKFFENPKDYKLVLFTGGEDVNPLLYGHTSPRRVCNFNLNRDLREMRIYRTAIRHGIKMAGICRGTQFCHALAGGKLMHHLTFHDGGWHWMKTVEGEAMAVNSLHHQMVIPDSNTILLGSASYRKNKHSSVALFFTGDGDKAVNYKGPESEAIISKNTGFFGVQYHPERLKRTEACFKFFERVLGDLLELEKKDFVSKWDKIAKKGCRDDDIRQYFSYRARRKGFINKA